MQPAGYAALQVEPQVVRQVALQAGQVEGAPETWTVNYPDTVEANVLSLSAFFTERLGCGA